MFPATILARGEFGGSAEQATLALEGYAEGVKTARSRFPRG